MIYITKEIIFRITHFFLRQSVYPQTLPVFLNETLFKTVIHLPKAHINSNSFHFVLVQTTQQVYDLDVVLVTNRSSHSTSLSCRLDSSFKQITESYVYVAILFSQ